RQEHAEHPALSLPEHRRHVVDRRLLSVLRHEPDGTDLLGDEHASIGQKRDAPTEPEVRDLRHRERQIAFRRLLARVDLLMRRRGREDQSQCSQMRLHDVGSRYPLSRATWPIPNACLTTKTQRTRRLTKSSLVQNYLRETS